MNCRSLKAFIFLSLFLCIACVSQAGAEVRWAPLGEDLETAQVSSSSSSFFPSYFTLIRSSLRLYRVSIVRAEEYGRKRASVQFLCSVSKGSVCINANFFDENGDPLGLVVNRGILARKMHKGGRTLNGVFSVTRSGPAIQNRFDLPLAAVLEAVQAGPLLLGNGEAAGGIRESSPASRRSGVCLDEAGRVILYIASANFTRIPIETLQTVLRYPGINCRSALNLDGGGSAQLYVNPNTAPGDSTYEILSVPGTDEVPVALSLVREAP